MRLPTGRRTRRAFVGVLTLLLVGLALAPAFPRPATGAVSFVTRDGSQLMLDGQPFYFTGFNIYNANSNGWCRTEYSDAMIRGAFDEIRGGNAVVRSWFFQTMATNGAGERDWTKMDQTVAAARDKGVRLIATLTDQWSECGATLLGYDGYKTSDWYVNGHATPDPTLLAHYGSWVSYDAWVAEVVARYRDEPAIMAWQLINEARVTDSASSGCPSDAAASQVLQDWARDVSTLVNDIDPNHLISLGTTGVHCGSRLQYFGPAHDLPNIDMCEYHDYYPTQPLPQPENNYEHSLAHHVAVCADLNKPLFVGEVGISRDDYSLQDRADLLAQKMSQQRDAGAAGHVVWQYAQPDLYPEQYDVYAGSGDPVIGVVGQAREPEPQPSNEPTPTLTPTPTPTPTPTATPSPPAGVTIEGVVTYADGSPAEGIALSLCTNGGPCIAATTDADGRYSFTELVPGDHQVNVLSPEGNTRYVTINGLGAGETRVEDIQLGGGLVYGVITDAAGAPVGEAGMHICGPIATTDGDTPRLVGCTGATTNSQGAYESAAFLPDGRHQISVYSPSIGTSPRLVAEFDSVGGSQELNIVLPAGAITGHVRMYDETPVASARVYACAAGRCYFADTDANGEYAMGYLPAGSYEVHASESGPTTETQSVVLDDGATEVVDITIPAGIVHGTVTGASGPAAGITVQLCSVDPSLGCSSAQSDIDGAYLMSDVFTGDYEASINIPKHTVSRPIGPVTVGAQPVDFDVFVDGVTLSGTVTDEGGNPFPDAWVVLCREDGCYAQARPAADGAVEINFVLNGEWTLRTLPDSLDYAETQTPISVGTTDLDQDVVIHPAPEPTPEESQTPNPSPTPSATSTPSSDYIFGRVTDTDGDPADSVLIEVCHESGCQELYTDENGNYQTDDLTQGVEYTVTVHPRYQDTSKFLLRGSQQVTYPGGAHELNFVLELAPLTTVEGYVRLADGTAVEGAPVAVCYAADPCIAAAPDMAFGGGQRFGTTNASGFYSIANVPVLDDPASFAYRDPANGANVSEGPEALDAPSHQHDFVINRLPGSITGTFRFYEGDPVADGIIRWAYCVADPDTEEPDWNRLPRTTDSAGQFAIEGLAATECVLVFAEHVDSGYVAGTEVTTGTDPVNVVLTLPELPGGGLRFLVLDHNGFPIEGSFVYGQGGHLDQESGYSFFEETDAAGRADLLYLRPSTVSGTAWTPDESRYVEFNVLVGSDVIDLVLTIPDVATGGIQGFVLDGNVPLPDTWVTACATRCYYGYTDQDGAFLISQLPAASYYLSVGVPEGTVADAGSPVVVGDEVVEHNVALPLGAISGRVVDIDQNAVAYGWVQACAPVVGCRSTMAGTDGEFVLGQLAPADYELTLYPPDNRYFTTAAPGEITVGQSTASIGDVVIDTLTPLPEDGSTSLSGSGVMSSSPGAVPSLLTYSTITLTTQACPGAFSAAYSVTSAWNATTSISGPMTETAPGTYEASFMLTFGGAATVSMTFDCPSSPDETIAFNVYIDPSGYVRDTLGEPVVEATVILYRSSTPSGPWNEVPYGDAIMSPANQANPDQTDETGHFGWDVIEGFYKVRAEKFGCFDPANHALRFVETQVYEIPPPVTDIDLRLSCGEETPSDSTPPQVQISAPLVGATYVLGSLAVATYNCFDEDGGSGLASCVGDVASGSAIDSSSVGPHQFTVVASDVAGNETATSVSYSVVYDFDGFSKVDPGLNREKAGGAIALKFSLGNVTGMSVLAAGSPWSAQIDCGTLVQIGAQAPTSQVGHSDLAFDSKGKTYSYKWKTDKAWEGTCRAFVLALNDGTEHAGYFDFRKKK